MKNYQLKLNNTRRIFLICIASMLIFVTAAFAADGDVDTSFGTNGIVNEGSPYSGFDTVVIQPDGKILAAGRIFIVTPVFANTTGVVRYNTNGSLDTTFGTGGRLTVEVAGGTIDFPTLVLQPDGKFVIVGRFSPTSGNPKIGIVRYNANGTVDTTFGTNGLTVSSFPEGNTNSQSDAVLQPDGKIVVSGSWRGTAFCVARWNADGTLDTSFGTSGGDTCVNTNATGATYSIALQADGKIVMSGGRTTSFTVPFDFVVFRFNPNGTPDTSFDGDGYVTTDLTAGNDNALSVLVRPNGKIIAVGSARAFNAPDTGFGLVQYNTDGSLDQSFGTAGKSLVTFAGGETFVEDFPAALQSNGKVVIGRSRRRASPNVGNESQIARFNENGSLDTTFGSGGQIIFLPIQNVRDLVLQPDGKIVTVGVNQPGFSITARFLNTDSAPTVNNPTLRFADFDGDGKSDISVYRAGTWFVNPSGSNLADAPQAAYGVQFGTSGDIPLAVDFDGDGKSDIAVWRPSSGIFYIMNSQNNTVRAEQFGQAGDNPTVSGDWDGDGKADLAVYRGAAESFFYYRPSAQPGVNFVPVQWGTTGDAPIFGDFDGDGKLDATIYRPAGNTFYVRRSSDGTFLTRQWGNAQTDAIFAGDFDGDGKSDFAVQRFSGADAGTWYVAQSGGTTRAVQWGAGSDAPVPADYDGDGKMDFAVFRRSNSTWYISNTASGAAQALTFGAGTDFPLPLNLIR